MVEVVNKLKHKATCQKCGSELEYGYGDVGYDKFILYHFIKCPICDVEIRVDDPNLDDDGDDLED